MRLVTLQVEIDGILHEINDLPLRVDQGPVQEDSDRSLQNIVLHVGGQILSAGPAKLVYGDRPTHEQVALLSQRVLDFDWGDDKLGTHLANALSNVFEYVYEVTQQGPKALGRIPNMGTTSVRRIKERLAEEGIPIGRALRTVIDELPDPVTPRLVRCGMTQDQFNALRSPVEEILSPASLIVIDRLLAWRRKTVQIVKLSRHELRRAAWGRNPVSEEDVDLIVRDLAQHHLMLGMDLSGMVYYLTGNLRW